MLINFTKMHGAGNDFVMLDGVNQTLELTPERIRVLAHRHLGVGADQIIVAEPATVPNADFRYRIYNADGSEAEHCGNGARCFIRFLHERGLTAKNPVRAQIGNDIITLKALEQGRVSVDMGTATFEPVAAGFDSAGLRYHREGDDTLWELDTFPACWISVVTISNPHAVQVVDNVDTAPVESLGPRIEGHPRFAARVNAGFMQVLDRHSIRLRVYERGAGETLSCGTGACAAALTGIRRGLVQSPVRVETRGGELTISWDGSQLRMIGPTAVVFEGTIALSALDAVDLRRIAA